MDMGSQLFLVTTVLSVVVRQVEGAHNPTVHDGQAPHYRDIHPQKSSGPYPHGVSQQVTETSSPLSSSVADGMASTLMAGRRLLRD